MLNSENSTLNTVRGQEVRAPGDEALRGQRRNRRILWTFIAMWLTVVLAPIPGYFMTPETIRAKGEFSENPRANYWGEVRQGASGYTTDQSPEAEVLVFDAGQNWRDLRNNQIAEYGGWLIVAVLVAIGAYYLIAGPIRVEGELSGSKIKRWNLYDCTVHWVVAVTFFVMAISGLILLYGRTILIPLFGKEGFAGLAVLCKDVHNLLGIPFAAALVLMILPWIKDNFFIAEDADWLAQAGGMLGGGHPSSGKNNAGEKLWFWLMTIGGAVLIASGVVLILPNLDPLRETMITMHILHSVSGLLLIAVSLGHSYMGSFGIEGAFMGMVTGEVDETWAKQHHDLWYAEQTGNPPPARRASSSGSSENISQGGARRPVGLATGQTKIS